MKSLSVISLMSTCSLLLFFGCKQPQNEHEIKKIVGLAPPEIIFSVDENQFYLPDSIMEGWNKIHFINKGNEPHIGQLIKLNENKTLENYVEDFKKAFQTKNNRPPYATRIGGANATNPQDTTVILQFLEPGRHVIGDIMDLDGTPNMLKGLIAEFDVISRSKPVEFDLPNETIEITLVDYAYGFKDQIKKGKHWIKLTNVGEQPHETAIGKLIPGKTLEDVHKWRKDKSSPPPFDMIFLSGLAAIAQDRIGYVEVKFEKGKYIFICFVTAPDGRSHADHGMAAVVEVD